MCEKTIDPCGMLLNRFGVPACIVGCGLKRTPICWLMKFWLVCAWAALRIRQHVFSPDWKPWMSSSSTIPNPSALARCFSGNVWSKLGVALDVCRLCVVS